MEVAGELAITTDALKRQFRAIDPRDARVILLDAGERVVSAFSERLSGKVAQQLAELGVTVREGARATAIDARGVTIEIGGATERIDTQNGHLGRRCPRRPAHRRHRSRDRCEHRPRRARRGQP